MECVLNKLLNIVNFINNMTVSQYSSNIPNIGVWHNFPDYQFLSVAIFPSLILDSH